MYMRKGERTGQTLRRIPIYYDEFIVLPLPFLDQFLAEAYRHNQAGARQAIDYLTTHSRQQGAVRRAQVLIALDWLNRCENTNEIAAGARRAPVAQRAAAAGARPHPAQVARCEPGGTRCAGRYHPLPAG